MRIGVRRAPGGRGRSASGTPGRDADYEGYRQRDDRGLLLTGLNSMTEEPSGPSATLAQRHVNRGKRRPEVFGERLVVEADYRDVFGAAQPAAAQSAN